MSEQQGEKTEQPSPRKLEEAQKRGQIRPQRGGANRVCVDAPSLCAMYFTGREMWQTMGRATAAMLGHLHDTPISMNSLQGQALRGALVLLQCVAPIVLAAMAGGLLAGTHSKSFQHRFGGSWVPLGAHQSGRRSPNACSRHARPCPQESRW